MNITPYIQAITAALKSPVPVRASDNGNISVDLGTNPVGRAQSATVTLAAGTNTIGNFVVPAGHKWKLKAISISYTGTVTGVGIIARMTINSVTFTFYNISPPVTNIRYPQICDILLNAFQYPLTDRVE